MPNIDGRPGIWTVIVTVDADADAIADMQAHAALGVQRFREYPGYVGGALHVSTDGTRLVQYLQWSSAAEYEACIADPAWDELPHTAAFLAHVSSGRARMQVAAFDVAAVAEGLAPPA